MKRKSGFYWVKRHGEWMVGEYAHIAGAPMGTYGWYLCGVEWHYNDSELEEINENIILKPENLSK